MNNLYAIYNIDTESEEGCVKLYETEERTEAIRMGRQLAKSFKDRITIEKNIGERVETEMEIDKRGHTIKQI